MFNVLGEPIDEVEPPQTEEKWAIHRPAPSFEEQATSQEMLETGIKVVDLLCPYQKGGKIGLFGGAGVGKDGAHPGAYPQHRYTAWWILSIYRCRRAYTRGK